MVPSSGPPDDDAPFDFTGERRTRRSKKRVLAQWVLIAATVVLLVVFRDRLPDVGAMLSAAAGAEREWLLLVLLAVAVSMGSFARLQRRLLRAGGVRMTLRRAFAVTYAGNALSTTLPAGPAVSVVYTFRQFRNSGATAQLATAVILVGGVITTTAYTVIGLLALLAAPQARGPAAAALLAPVPVALVLVRRGTRARLVAFTCRVVRAVLEHRRVAPYARALRDGGAALRPSRRDWAALVLLAVMNWVFDILALFAAAQAVGIDVAPPGVALAYFAAQAAGSLIPVLPGGLGAVDGSMAASLVALGAALAPAGAAVGLYRLVSYVVVVVVGWLAWAVLHEGLPARTRRVSARAGREILDGLAAVAIMTMTMTAMRPHTAARDASPAGPRRP
ncbi:YbhN family protein [Actinomadura vinacea]|uniref:lysylphosphatidylglycerol synthase transmembrane domain-containing protein n=1 Tax=Actinomadura vinacea TaxID=115336 RepID=UPI0031E0E629